MNLPKREVAMDVWGALSAGQQCGTCFRRSLTAYSTAPMNVLNAFEHEQIESLTDAARNTLDALRGPRNERLFEVGWRATRATSFVGIVQLPTATLQILPKMYRHEKAREHEVTAGFRSRVRRARRI